MKMGMMRVLSLVATVLTFVTTAAAQDTAAGTTGGRTVLVTGALAVGIAALGGALGDGRAIAAACEGTARNPGAGGRIFTMMILGLALIETLVLFTFLMAFLER
jgi:F-type H+-transporting ATPase subunit c